MLPHAIYDATTPPGAPRLSNPGSLARSYKDALAAGLFTVDPAAYFDDGVCAVSTHVSCPDAVAHYKALTIAIPQHYLGMRTRHLPSIRLVFNLVNIILNMDLRYSYSLTPQYSRLRCFVALLLFYTLLPLLMYPEYALCAPQSIAICLPAVFRPRAIRRWRHTMSWKSSGL